MSDERGQEAVQLFLCKFPFGGGSRGLLFDEVHVDEGDAGLPGLGELDRDGGGQPQERVVMREDAHTGPAAGGPIAGASADPEPAARMSAPPGGDRYA